MDAKVREMQAEMLLSELRKHAELTQVQVAEALGITTLPIDIGAGAPK